MKFRQVNSFLSALKFLSFVGSNKKCFGFLSFTSPQQDECSLEVFFVFLLGMESSVLTRSPSILNKKSSEFSENQCSEPIPDFPFEREMTDEFPPKAYFILKFL